jgi:hypothetical protein
MALLEDMCAAVPPPDQERLAPLRARVLAADPVRARPGRGRADGGRGRRRVPAVSRPRLVLSGGLAIAAGAAVVAVGIPFGGALAPRASAAQVVLGRAAKKALTQPTPRGDQFIYADVEVLNFPVPPGQPLGAGLGAGQTATSTLQIWQSADGARAGTVRATGCSFAGQLGAGISFPLSEGPCTLAIRPSRDLPATATYAGLRTLPTSPGALLAYIDAHFSDGPGNSSPPGVFSWESPAVFRWDGLSAILSSGMAVPPALAAAIFRAAAMLPGTILLRHVIDLAGRRGIVVAMPEPGGYGMPDPAYLSELIFDPGTYQFIGYRDLAVGHPRRVPLPSSMGGGVATFGDPAGTVEQAWAVLRTGITDTAPPGPADPAAHSYESSAGFEFSR